MENKEYTHILSDIVFDNDEEIIIFFNKVNEAYQQGGKQALVDSIISWKCNKQAERLLSTEMFDGMELALRKSTSIGIDYEVNLGVFHVLYFNAEDDHYAVINPHAHIDDDKKIGEIKDLNDCLPFAKDFLTKNPDIIRACMVVLSCKPPQ